MIINKLRYALRIKLAYLLARHFNLYALDTVRNIAHDCCTDFTCTRAIVENVDLEYQALYLTLHDALIRADFLNEQSELISYLSYCVENHCDEISEHDAQICRLNDELHAIVFSSSK